MWLMDVEFDGRQLEGTLINAPISLQTFHEGDRVTVSGRQISDWMYVYDEDVYFRFLGGGAKPEPQNPAVVAATEHPMWHAQIKALEI